MFYTSWTSKKGTTTARSMSFLTSLYFHVFSHEACMIRYVQDSEMPFSLSLMFHSTTFAQQGATAGV
jgi:hypothetical protein